MCQSVATPNRGGGWGSSVDRQKQLAGRKGAFDTTHSIKKAKEWEIPPGYPNCSLISLASSSPRNISASLHPAFNLIFAHVAILEPIFFLKTVFIVKKPFLFCTQPKSILEKEFGWGWAAGGIRVSIWSARRANITF